MHTSAVGDAGVFEPPVHTRLGLPHAVDKHGKIDQGVKLQALGSTTLLSPDPEGTGHRRRSGTITTLGECFAHLGQEFTAMEIISAVHSSADGATRGGEKLSRWRGQRAG